MPSNVHLIIHNIGMGISGVLVLCLAVMVYFNNPSRRQNILLALAMLATGVFIFSHIIGVSVLDPYLSRKILMFNMSTIFLVIFNAHCILCVLNIEKKRKPILIAMYAIGIILCLIYIIFPDTFLAPSVPKMYFPNYYVPGTLHWIMRLIFNGIIPLYFMTEIALAYRATKNSLKDNIEKNRYLYFLEAFILGYGIGSIPILLVYNIQVDPAWGVFFVIFYAIPFVYAIMKYELLDIRIIAKQAFVYAIFCVIVGGFIILLDFSNQWLNALYPGFPFWLIPSLSSVVVVGVSIFVWRKLREGDLLKYEFITIVTHKFRTPLTYIKWATENLSKGDMTEDQKMQTHYIKSANEKLVELTDLLARASDAENKEYSFQFRKENLTNMIDDILSSSLLEFQAKNMTLVKRLDNDVEAVIDPSQIKFVLQILIENALHYTPKNGKVTVSLHKDKRNITFSVSDNGIGVPPDRQSLIFSKFYRSDEARKADTEGMGIGLYLSREIISRHKGKIWMTSEGIGRGSIFTFSLPA